MFIDCQLSIDRDVNRVLIKMSIAVRARESINTPLRIPLVLNDSYRCLASIKQF